MKVIDFTEANSFLKQVVKKYAERKDPIVAFEKAVAKLKSLEGVLEGEGADALKEHYQDQQMPVINKYKEFRSQTMIVFGSIRGTLNEMEDENALWRESFMSDKVPSGLNAFEEAAEENLSEINATIASVDDLVSINPIQTDSLFEATETARTHSQETAEALVEFDDDSTEKIEPLEELSSEWSNAVAKIG
ncbi:T7SS effector LXG polymorphic toxin [Shouchella lonarensis]|uniref:LXG domain of WXG superfamily protein n=1 Tax=Shouchella lonarensis TaxID=1464122 RepID=A0A1G6HYL7_9BACI|nr:T7SS effector LXG polymorphic toxin [Shouchella lonarensis]SDB99280.1 LXG domain of WXG superfamily protein [Shouchella lonarensis]